MTREQLDALKGHTPGPWVNKCTEYGFRYVQTPYGHTFVAYTTSPQSMSDGDARIITAAPDLLDHIDEQQRKIDRLRELLSYAVEWAQDRGYDLPEVAPEWFLSALKETSDD